MAPPDDLAVRLAADYDLPPPIGCRLLRSYTNDVYIITPGDGHRHVLKVYGSDWRTGAEVRWEADLVRHLCAAGLPVPAPVRRRDGDFLTSIGPRPAVLSEYAPGGKPAPPFSLALYREFGRALARMHAASGGFMSPHPRRPLDLPLLLDEPLALALPFTGAADAAFLHRLVDQLREAIGPLVGALDYGPVHGDATLDNLHVTDGGEVILFDFDSGGPGWRAADLQGWALLGGAEHRPKWDAFLEGYASVRAPSPADLAAPLLTLAWDVWGLGVDLSRRVLPQGEGAARAFLSGRVTTLREREPALFGS